MPTTTTEASANPGRDDYHNRQAAGLQEAMALRYYVRYLQWRHTSETNGGDVGKYDPTDMTTAHSRYDELVREWVFETPGTTRAAMALIEFATLIAVDQISSDVMMDGRVNGETDALHQAVALGAAAKWINENVAYPEFDKQCHARLAARGIRTASGQAETSRDFANSGDAVSASPHPKGLAGRS